MVHPLWKYVGGNHYLGFISEGVIIARWRESSGYYDDESHFFISVTLYQEGPPIKDVSLYSRTFSRVTPILVDGFRKHVRNEDWLKEGEDRWSLVIDGPPQMIYDVWKAVQT